MVATFPRLSLAAAALVTITATAAVAQDEGGSYIAPPPPSVPPGQFFFPPAVAEPASLSAATTDRVVAQIDAARNFCGRLSQREYVIDCLASELAQVAGDMPAGEYAEARQAIDRAARKLRALATENADPVLPKGRVRLGTGGPTSARPVTPVRSNALNALNDQAAAILEEAETVLLRSAESSERRMVHYQRIAGAVGSTKVLLRSI